MNMKKTIILAASILALLSCSEKNIDVPYGRISLGVSSDMEIVVTKGITGEVDLRGYNISLIKEGVCQWTKEYEGIVESDLIVPAGSYSIYVENLTDAEAHASGMGLVRVAGSESFEVIGDAITDCAVHCKPVNSKVSCIYTENFKVVYGNTAVVTLDKADRDLEMQMTPFVGEEGVQIYGSEAYFAAEQEITWDVNAAVLGVAKHYTGKFTTIENKHTVIKFDAANSGMISIKVTVNDEISDVEELDVPIDPLS